MISTVPTHKALWHSGQCTVCGGRDFRNVLHLKNVPSQDGVVWSTKKEALAAPRGDIDLRFCRSCGYLGNAAYDPEKVKFQGYDVSLEFSDLYKEFVTWLIQHLVEKYGIRKKTVLEVACGKGHFLRALCHYGDNKGIGFDPSFEAEGASEDNNVQFIRDYYTKTYAHYHADLLCCRQMVDILDAPRDFLMEIRDALAESPNVVGYFEIPNAAATWEKFVPWNVVYEHCSWYMPKAIASFFETCGFEVLDVYPCHQGEYLGIEVRRGDKHTIATRMTKGEIIQFEEHLVTVEQQMKKSISTWQEKLGQIQASGRRLAAWGAGARAIGFLNALQVYDQIQYVADINPRRRGKFLPGTGQEVVTPEFLVAHAPEVIIITNPTYETEIKKQAGALGLQAEFITL